MPGSILFRQLGFMQSMEEVEISWSLCLDFQGRKVQIPDALVVEDLVEHQPLKCLLFSTRLCDHGNLMCCKWQHSLAPG